jgi:hypothetical protein
LTVIVRYFMLKTSVVSWSSQEDTVMFFFGGEALCVLAWLGMAERAGEVLRRFVGIVMR